MKTTAFILFNCLSFLPPSDLFPALHLLQVHCMSCMHLSVCKVTYQCRKHIGYKCIYTPLMQCDFQQGRVSCSGDLHSKQLTKKEPLEASEVIWLQVLFYLFHTLEHERCVSAGRECREVRSACVCVCVCVHVCFGVS